MQQGRVILLVPLIKLMVTLLDQFPTLFSQSISFSIPPKSEEL